MVIPFFYRGQSGVVTAISKGVPLFLAPFEMTEAFFLRKKMSSRLLCLSAVLIRYGVPQLVGDSYTALP